METIARDLPPSCLLLVLLRQRCELVFYTGFTTRNGVHECVLEFLGSPDKVAMISWTATRPMARSITHLLVGLAGIEPLAKGIAIFFVA
jgi:hypothetical protein